MRLKPGNAPGLDKETSPAVRFGTTPEPGVVPSSPATDAGDPKGSTNVAVASLEAEATVSKLLDGAEISLSDNG